ncbi:T9SS type A sorting domain-containing protein [Flavobacterium enshiense]|nr:T9SS type A sorting domain-containing protein [Flavobacterium enshiense]
MREYCFIFSFVLVAISVKAQIITISDPAFKAKLLSANTLNSVAQNAFGNNVVIDLNSNNEIEVSETATIVSINVASSNVLNPGNIASLDGIQNFTNLKKLNCAGNHITNLDVSSLSLLEELKCNNNEITTLNISGLATLKKINCNHNNLTSLSTDNFINLTELFLYDNHISSLSFNNNPNLQSLNCSMNVLPSLNVSTLPALKYLVCNSNQLASLNLNGLTQIREVVCSNNNLTTLDLTGLSTITFLLFEANQITTVDLSPLSSVTYLECSYNPLTSINMDGLTTLYHLAIEGTPLSTIDCSQSGVQQLFCSNNPNLNFINVKNNHYSHSDPDMLNFAFRFENLPSLTGICVDNGEQNNLVHTNYNSSGNVIVYTGTNCATVVDMSTADINEFNQNNAVTLYPNPVQDRISLKFENLYQIKSIAIYNQLGQLIKSSSELNNDNEISLNVDQLEAGSYLISIESEKGKQIKKFIKL